MLPVEDPIKMAGVRRDAVLYRDRHLEKTKDLVANYAGEAYRDDFKQGWSENHCYEFIRATTSRIVYNNPRYRVRSRQGGTRGAVAKAIQLGLNRWAHDTRLRRILKQLYVQMCFGWGVAQVVNEARPWMNPTSPVQSFWPQVYPIPMTRFFFDPLTPHFGASRYSGFDFPRDKDDLIEEAEMNPDSGWNLKALKSLGTDSGVEKLNRERTEHMETRNEVVLTEMWIPEYQTGNPDEGYNGTIITMALGAETPERTSRVSTSTFIREPRPFYGPKSGPFTLFGVYPVLDDPFPLAPLIATHQQQREYNEVTKATMREIKAYKRFILVDADNNELAKAIRDTPNQHVKGIRGLRDIKNQTQAFEMGGITTQHAQQLAMAKDRLDRNTGSSAPHQGQVGSGSTATEIAVADQSVQDSLAFIKDEFESSTVDVSEKVAWYMFHDDRISFPLGDETAKEYEPIMLPDGSTRPAEPWFQGGNFAEGSGGRFEDLELEIEPYSMERTNESLARAQFNEMTATLMNVLPLVPQTPYFAWEQWLGMMGDTHNRPEMSDLIDVDLAAQFAGMGGAVMPGAPNAQLGKQSGGPVNQGNLMGGMLAKTMGGSNGR